MTCLDAFGELIGSDPDFLRVIEDARLAAATPFTVLLTGETGTGKSLIARGIHEASDRSSKSFVLIDLGLLPKETQDAELFGYVRGAFTGASDKGRDGLLAAADKGTVLFDEVGDASAATQSKLLRLLQERKIRRMGSNDEISLDIRVIAATNRKINEMTQKGRFRADLYYRLKVIVLNIPPLRDRSRSDFESLTDHFLKKHAISGRDISIDAGVRDFLWEYPARWPGNVRELEATIQRLIALSESDKITRPIAQQIIDRQVTPEERFQIESNRARRETLQYARDSAEKQQIEETLRKYAGSRTRVASELEMSTRTLSRLIKKHGIGSTGAEE